MPVRIRAMSEVPVPEGMELCGCQMFVYKVGVNEKQRIVHNRSACHQNWQTEQIKANPPRPDTDLPPSP